MLPRFTARGAAALGKLKVFEGVPAPYDLKKKLVVPDALRVVRLKNYRKYCTLGDLAAEVGWGKRSLVAKLEDKRRVRAEAWHKKRLEVASNVRKAQNATEINKLRTELAQYGY
jgi:large subunit ribosomal protein L13Ae